MNIESKIRDVLFEIGKDIKIHKIDNDNTIIEIDYEKYVEKLKSIVEGCNPPPRMLK
jgi:hypothetical protein